MLRDGLESLRPLTNDGIVPSQLKQNTTCSTGQRRLWQQRSKPAHEPISITDGRGSGWVGLVVGMSHPFPLWLTKPPLHSHAHLSSNLTTASEGEQVEPFVLSHCLSSEHVGWGGHRGEEPVSLSPELTPSTPLTQCQHLPRQWSRSVGAGCWLRGLGG